LEKIFNRRRLCETRDFVQYQSLSDFGTAVPKALGTDIGQKNGFA